MPMPVSGTVCGLDASLSVTLKVADSAAKTEGVKVTAIAHVAPAAIVPLQFVLPMTKSAEFAPLSETFVMVMLLPVRLASVTICA